MQTILSLVSILSPYLPVMLTGLVFLIPAHSQVDDARERRQIAEWNAALDAVRER